ncbi:MAG TPA: acyl carrier protein [Chitinophagaceae bacterium]|nr:acyl carrier protein [Chitinophagaceae bacterium]
MSHQTIREWLIRKISEETGLAEQEIQTAVPFDSFQLDSLSMVSLAYELEKFAGRPIDPTVFWEHDTIEKLSEWITRNPN